LVREGLISLDACAAEASLLKDYAIIFGAGVSAEGRPSAVLRHRIDGALAWAREHPAAMLMPTGGVGRQGPAEAEVVREILIEAGVAPERIVAEACGRDTLESVRLCDAILRRRGDCGRIVCCTSTYHQPRCALLLRLLGYTVVLPGMPNGWGRLSTFRYARTLLKEMLATPYDAMLLLATKRRTAAEPRDS
jgi:uncharacterized SAM-binding protein YcdF (DUF218 family)